MTGAPEPGYFINEKKWIDSSSWAIIQSRYLENGQIVVEGEMRAATPVDVMHADLVANLFDAGAVHEIYCQANVTELQRLTYPRMRKIH